MKLLMISLNLILLSFAEIKLNKLDTFGTTWYSVLVHFSYTIIIKLMIIDYKNLRWNKGETKANPLETSLV